MKITFLSLAVFASVALAAPPAKPGKSASCVISGFRPVWTKINACCVKNKGRTHFDKIKNNLICKLPISREGSLRKCVKALGHATVVACKKN